MFDLLVGYISYLKHVLHVMVSLPEGRPLDILPLPAVSHQTVDPRWTPWRTFHPVAALQQLKIMSTFTVLTIISVYCQFPDIYFFLPIILFLLK